MMSAAASTSAGDRRRAPNTPSSATMTTASVSMSPKSRSLRYRDIRRRPQSSSGPDSARIAESGQRGIDPDAQHRRLVDVGGVIPAQPSAQDALARWPSERRPRPGSPSRQFRWSAPRARSGCARALPCSGSSGRRPRGTRPRQSRDRRPECSGSRARRTRHAPRRGARPAQGCRRHPVRSGPSCCSSSSISGPNSSAGGGGPSAGCTLTPARSPNNVRCSTSVMAISTRSSG